jgi:3-oxoacyl-[acyl-carrier protein] reductase
MFAPAARGARARGGSHRALAVRGDVTNPRDLKAVVDCSVEAFGGLDIVVWNSGGPPPGPGDRDHPGKRREAVELLLAPLVRLVDFSLPHLVQSAGGRILVFTSSAVKEPTEHLALSNTIRPV